MTRVTLENYTKNDIAWLGEMVAEMLADLGYEQVGSFTFSIEVEFEDEENEEYDNHDS